MDQHGTVRIIAMKSAQKTRAEHVTFEECVEIILKHEGGYVNDPDDPGGATKYGISKAAHPDVDIPTLTYEKAKAIYKKEYWDAPGLESKPANLRLMYFDCAVNQGKGAAATIYKTAGNDVGAFARARMKRYRENKNWKKYGAGWMCRLLDVTIECLK